MAKRPQKSVEGRNAATRPPERRREEAVRARGPSPAHSDASSTPGRAARGARDNASTERGKTNEKTKDGARAEASWLGAWAIGFVLAAATGSALLGWSGCKHEPPPGATNPPAPAPIVSVARSVLGPDAAVAPPAEPVAAADPNRPYDGPLIGAMVSQAPIYVGMEAYRDKRIGYLRQGGKAAVDPTPQKAANCEAGWYRLLGGGYICGKFATLDLNQPLVRLGIAPPNFDDILPYRYAANITTGTPLYKSVPSREDIAQYEPYLRGQGAKRKGRSAGETETATLAPVSDNPYGPDPALVTTPAGSAAVLVDDRRPWWLAEGDKPDIKLSDLTEGADALVAKRMFKGFYVAIDRQFNWNNRLWYKTTAALVAPADRLVIREPPTFKGIELTGTETSQPAGFILGTKAWKYEVDPDKKTARPTASAERFTTAVLTGRTVPIGNTTFRETKDGWWMRTLDGTYTDPAAPPAGLAEGEKWIDVNLSRQTLVAFEGDRPQGRRSHRQGARSPNGAGKFSHSRKARLDDDGRRRPRARRHALQHRRRPLRHVLRRLVRFARRLLAQ